MAEFFKWDPQTLSVAVKEMDDEHIVLIKKMNLLHEAYSAKKERTQIAPLLIDFVNYTVKHFADEEAYMSKTGFSGFEVHKAVHQ